MLMIWIRIQLSLIFLARSDPDPRLHGTGLLTCLCVSFNFELTSDKKCIIENIQYIQTAKSIEVMPPPFRSGFENSDYFTWPSERVRSGAGMSRKADTASGSRINHFESKHCFKIYMDTWMVDPQQPSPS
jgi:hypothetical protein